MLAVVIVTILLSACSEIQRPQVEPFYSVTEPPRKQELRWSNGKMPKSVDPARARAAPETDVVRALYEGLTNLDPVTLKETPGVAESWTASEDFRVWTFELRKDARWSNGDRVVANDFVRSWKRVVSLGDKAANVHLFHNIVGIQEPGPASEMLDESTDFPDEPTPNAPQQPGTSVQGTVDSPRSPDEPFEADAEPPPPVTEAVPKEEPPPPSGLGAVAVDQNTLRIKLIRPDKDLPKLLANPVFRPVHGNGAELEHLRPGRSYVTNGPFRMSAIEENAISLERSETYWNKDRVMLDRVRFAAADSAEAALAAYRRGEVDVVTNAGFEPVALKLLAPYEDFRRNAHNALNFYEFNTAKPPFDDRRVREALTIAIDRGKLADGDLEGTTQPADRLFASGDENVVRLQLDIEKARQLLEKAGFPNGAGFPTVRLVVNRNDVQQRVARSVARMWKQNLNVDTNIEIKETADIGIIRGDRDFDVIRRGAVLPTNDELVSLSSILGSFEAIAKQTAVMPDNPKGPGALQPPLPDLSEHASTQPDSMPAHMVLTEQDLIGEFRVIPLYFPVSYSLVKPYVLGFETNELDATPLSGVSIDSNWRVEASVSSH